VNTQIENNKISTLGIFKKISTHLDGKRRKEIKFIFFLSFLSSIAESISIAMLVPFVSFFFNPESYIFNTFLKSFFDSFNIINKKDILLAVTLIFIFIVLTGGIIKIVYIKFSNKLADNITSDFRILIFKFLLNQDFNYYVKNGTSKIMSNLTQKTMAFTAVIFSALNFVNSIIVSCAIILVLIYNEPFYTPILITIITLFFFILYKLRSLSVLKRGQVKNLNQNLMVDIFQDSVGYFPEIIIYNLRTFFYTAMKKLSIQTSKTSSEVRTIAMTPKIWVETSVMLLVILFVFFSDYSERSIEANITYLAILAFGAQKILPLANYSYSLSITIKAAVPIVNDFLKIVGDKKPNEINTSVVHDVLKFEKKIKLENISFQYNENLPNILDGLNFNIYKGEKIAIKGETGSGKTTLVNIISGLFEPSHGKVFIDDVLINSKNLKNWQKNIALVPQAVFLNDATIIENIAIALDVNSIDIEKAKNSAKIAQIDEFIETLPNKYYEKVGERGVRLSGGQKQRLGIARALYRDAKLIILDEPTNAVDVDTEKLIMDSIMKLSKEITLIMVSHSNNSLKYFDKIIDLDKLK
jgi:ABC-type multidrug transport system fused ATPase/permease subunit